MKSSRDWRSLAISPSSTSLLLGWRPRTKRLDAERIAIGSEVGEALREIARTSLDSVGEMRQRPYEDTAAIARGEEYFALRVDSIPLATPDSRASAVEDDDAAEEAVQLADLLRILSNPAGRGTIMPGQARDGTFLFYALVCEDRNRDPIAFVKQQPGLRVARTGKLLTLFSDRLTRIQDPVFAFANDFDLIFHGGELAILRSEAYVQLFTDVEVLKAAVPAYVERVASSIAVPLSDESAQLVRHECAERPSLAKRLRRLSNKAWLAKITAQSLQEQLNDMQELPDGVRVHNGQVVVAEGSVPLLLNLFEDLYYRGHHDTTLRTAQSYTFGLD